ATKEESRTESYSAPEPGQVAPAYAQISSTGYTGNKYFATRRRLSYHPPNKQFTGSTTNASMTTTSAPPPPAPEPQISSSRGTLPAGMKDQEKKPSSMWKAKGSEYENYVSEETHAAPSPPPASTHTAPEPAKPRPAASGPTHGTLPAGMKPTPPPATKEESRTESYSAPEPGQVAPAYAQISSTGYTGNKYFATRRRLSYHPPNKQFTGSGSTTTAAPPAPEPPKPKTMRGTLPAGFKP
ncbi:MAG: hypothetical protein KGI08_05000, partial [Thaumarchaeota archaeon]|nr:hypothetical protein [Nitrososphaerota archaeon]